MTTTTAPHQLSLGVDRVSAFDSAGDLLVGAFLYRGAWRIYLPHPGHHVDTPSKSVAMKHVEMIAQLMTGDSQNARR